MGAAGAVEPAVGGEIPLALSVSKEASEEGNGGEDVSKEASEEGNGGEEEAVGGGEGLCSLLEAGSGTYDDASSEFDGEGAEESDGVKETSVGLVVDKKSLKLVDVSALSGNLRGTLGTNRKEELRPQQRTRQTTSSDFILTQTRAIPL